MTDLPLSNEVEHEDIITVRLIHDSIREEAQRITRRFSKLRTLLDSTRKELESRSIERKVPYLSRVPKNYPKDFCVLALDTSFTSPPIELTGGRLGVIFRVAAQFGSCKSRVVDHSALVKFVDESEHVISLISKIIERRYVLSVLERAVKGYADFDIVIMDGELLPRIPPGAIIGRVRSASPLATRLYSELVELTNKIMELADKAGITIVGTLKRVYGKDIQVMLDNPQLDITDKALASYILTNGEYINLGTYIDIVNAYEKFIKLHEEFKSRLGQRFRWLKNIVSHLPMSSAINVLIYKSSSKTYFSIPTKIELQISNEYTMEDIVGYLASITSLNGVPFPIDVVDRLSRVRREVLFLAQQNLYALLTKMLGDSRLALSIIGLTNPEKMKVIGFKT